MTSDRPEWRGNRCHRLLGVPISVLGLADIAAGVVLASAGQGGYVGVCNVHSLITAGRDRELSRALEGAIMNTADGMPLVWALRRLGHRSATRVYGQALMEVLLASSDVSRHYLVGSTERVQERLVARVRDRFPRAEIVGRWIPPFADGVPELPALVRSDIVSRRPQVVWVGLGCPRQEKWMALHWESLAPAVLIGVGAAFDFPAGTKRPAPAWMRGAGLEWLFRLVVEPRRLAWRYLSTNPVFAWRIIAQVVRENRGRSAAT